MSRSELVTSSADVRSFFHESVAQAMHTLDLRADDHTIHYIVSLLTLFTRSESFYEKTSDGTDLKPLALMLADAVDAQTTEARNRALKRLGDVALFVAGLFAGSLSRSLVDLDYYIAMGGNAYGSLSDYMGQTDRGIVFAGVYRELAAKFAAFVDVLGEVGDQAHAENDALRLYEIWMRTGSPRAMRRLRSMGVVPLESARTPFRH